MGILVIQCTEISIIIIQKYRFAFGAPLARRVTDDIENGRFGVLMNFSWGIRFDAAKHFSEDFLSSNWPYI